MNKKIAVIVGSLRKESFNKKMANVLISLAPSSLKLELIEIGNLPLYNQDLDDENTVPPAWTHFREQMKSCEGVIFVTPEYNRSIPGVLKNAIDVGSRPYGYSIWSKKPGAIISVSPSAIGGFGANQHLRQTFVFLDIPVLQQPEAYIGQAGNLFNAKNELVREDTKKFLSNFIETYANWVELNTRSVS
ncbi:NADPH-dependent FMN reductase [Legionella sp.]|uniref:NADPH-dependent FMN reductase n=1 Tax=Legionella sp. TaxID=459 RepID=UPI003CB668E1